MTPTTAPSAAPPKADPRATPTARRTAPPDKHRVQDFERALRDKAARADETPQRDDAELASRTQQSPPQQPPFGPLSTAANLLPLQRDTATSVIDAPRSTPPNVEPAAHAALQETAPPSITQPTTPRAFEVTLNEPLGVPLSLRITEPADAARWSVSVASSNLNLAQLKRHSERLDTRLRSRALSHEPVEFEPLRHDPDDPTR